MNQLAGTPCFWKRCSSRGVPTSPENIPRWMSDGESSPPYEPSQPPTASMSTPNTAMISLGNAPSPCSLGRSRSRRHRLRPRAAVDRLDGGPIYSCAAAPRLEDPLAPQPLDLAGVEAELPQDRLRVCADRPARRGSDAAGGIREPRHDAGRADRPVRLVVIGDEQ